MVEIVDKLYLIRFSKYLFGTRMSLTFPQGPLFYYVEDYNHIYSPVFTSCIWKYTVSKKDSAIKQPSGEKSFKVEKTEKDVRDLTCMLCQEVVKQKKDFGARRFGLLDKCEHAFCLPCIRNYQAQRQLKAFPIKDPKNCLQYPSIPVICPVCRAKSQFILSSSNWIDDLNHKTQYVEQYKREVKDIPCKWVQLGQGKCLYGSHCGHVEMRNCWEQKSKSYVFGSSSVTVDYLFYVLRDPANTLKKKQ